MKKFSKRLLAVMLSVLMVITVLPFGAMTAYAATLTQAKNNYVNKINTMRNGTVYNNLLPAYLAYVEACKDGAGQDQADALQAAVDNMTVFSQNADMYNSFQSVSINGTETTGYYGNVLYSADPGTVKYSDIPHGFVSWSNGILKYSADWFIYQRGGVLLYDGTNNAELPVVFADKENMGRYSFRFRYVRESGGRLKDYWYGHTIAGSSSSDSTDYAISWAGKTEDTYDAYVPVDVNASDYYDAENKHGGNSYYWNFNNSLVFTLSDTQLYKKYSRFEWNTYPYWGNLVTGNEHVGEGDNSLNTTEPVYVLNYKMLLDAMQASITKYKDTYLDVSSDGAKAGGSTEIFAAFDNATGLNLSNANYHYDTDLEAGFEKAWTDLDDAINDLDGVNGAEGSINTIVSMLNLFEANMAADPFRLHLADTYALYLKGKECFDAYIYGQNRSDEFIAVLKDTANKLEKAVANCTPMKDAVIKGDYHPDDGVKYFSGDSSSGNAAYTFYNTSQGSPGESSSTIAYSIAAQNLLYYEQATNPIYSYSPSSTYIAGIRMYHSNNIVLLYDGITTPRFPVAATFSNQTTTVLGMGGTNAYVDNFYPTDADAVSMEKKDISSAAKRESSGFFVDNSASFEMATQRNVNGKHSGTVSGKYWIGRVHNDGSNIAAGYEINWKKGASYDESDVILGGKEMGYNTDSYRLWIRKYGASAYVSSGVSSVDYVGKKFTNDPSAYLDNYDHLNWNFIGHAGSSSSGLHTIFKAPASINVINVKPILDARASLLENTDVKDVLQHLFLYDEDSADLIDFLKKIDGIGSFDPNSYDYSKTTGGTHGNSANPGVDQCVEDMKTAINSFSGVADAVVNEAGKTVADDTTAGDNKIRVPSADELEKTSSSTEASNPDDTNWYGDLREALLNPLKKDECTVDSAWDEYTAALTAAQNAISAPAIATTDSYYPSEYSSKTIHEYAEELNEATAKYKTAGSAHTYLYADEDEDQLSEWECVLNSAHIHGTADMSAYNELEIAYKTLDLEAYQAAASSAMKTAYEDDFVPIKTKSTEKGQTPQNYVDQGVIDLLTAIGEAAGEGEGESQLKSYDVQFRIVVDGEEPVDVWSTQTRTYDFGTTISFDATEFASFPDNATCYKWTVRVGDGAAQTIYHAQNSLSNYVQGATVVTAYVNTPATDENVNVMILGPTDNVLYSLNVDKDAKVVFNDADSKGNISITIGDKTYDIARTYAYKNTEWTIGVQENDKVYSGATDDDGNEYTVESLRAERGLPYLKLVPHVEMVATDGYVVRYSGNTPATININGTDQELGEVTVDEKTYANGVSGVKYDDKVRITYTPDDSKGEFYGIAINVSEMAGGTVPKYVPISYSNEFYFLANSTMNVYPIYKTVVQKGDSTANVYTVDDGRNNGAGTKITNPTDRYYLNRHLPFVVDQFDTENVTGKYVFRVMFTQNIPDDANVTITEHGRTYLALNSESLVSDIAAGEGDIVIGKTFTSGGKEYSVTKKASSKTYDQQSHQFSFSNTKPTGYAYMIARGYVKYTYDFSQTVVDVDETGDETIETVDAPVEAISYGRADYFIQNS
ncbi:MAG: hypothetical protein IJ168_05030 [Eubacterium sp.]|nr:hypothetical protein [Eubacterium sp.]